jgi:hypothetical protein
MARDKHKQIAAKVANGVYRLEIPTPFSVGAVNVYLVE